MKTCSWCGTPTKGQLKVAYCKGTLCKSDAQMSKKQSIQSISTIESIWLLISQKLKCAGCKKPWPPSLMENDHYIPTSKGGPRNDINNIQIMCCSCNRFKYNQIMADFLASHRAWYEFKMCGKLAIHNFLNYCKHKRIKERCEGLIEKTIKPHTPNELIAAPSVLAYINKLSKSVI